MSILYYATRLSDNIARTDEGFLLCRNAVIARTGFQKYKGSELPPDQLKELEFELGPNDVIEVYRSPEEVFSSETIGSFEGKPVTDDHPPGAEFVDTSNVDRLLKGHVQNVRKGDEPLDNGDWPLLGDLVLTHPELISRVEGGDRELSCGYNYNLGRDGDRLEQIEIRGNHVAVVRRGRAGPEARINDSAPGTVEVKTKEKKPVKVSDRLLHLLGLGLKAKAADADTTPEELAESAREVARISSGRATDARKGEDRHNDAHDNETGNVGEGDLEGESRMTDRRGKDDDPERQRLHEALDRVYDARKVRDASAAEEAESKDVDLDALKGLLDEYLTEEEGEEEHSMDSEEEGEEAEVVEGEDSEEVAEKETMDRKGRAKDNSTLVEPISIDSRARETEHETVRVLRALRPLVAKSKDKALISAFNNVSSQVNRRSRAGSSGYTDAIVASRTRDSKVRESGRAMDGDVVSSGDHAAKNNKMFEERRQAYRK